MFINTNMLMELHKARESDLLHRAKNSMNQGPAGRRKLTLGKRLMHTIANTLFFMRLR